ncbi:MAG: hypothetical protein LBM02_05170 [Lachnospiraceae bacterium]|nr:hypothetical protein [Lachnospiraceae bacterium]
MKKFKDFNENLKVRNEDQKVITVSKIEGYLAIAYILFIAIAGTRLLFRADRSIFWGVAALTLGFGDFFYLFPRILTSFGYKKDLNSAMGYGKFINSITSTGFYVILYILFLKFENFYNSLALSFIIIILVLTRLILCLLPGNRWRENTYVGYLNIWRNLPFILLGIIVSDMFLYFSRVPIIGIFIILSLAFYVPVVLFANRNPKLEFLMFPRTMMYVGIIIVFFFL